MRLYLLLKMGAHGPRITSLKIGVNTALFTYSQDSAYLIFSPEGAPSGYSQLAPDSQLLSVELLKIRLITEKQWVALKIAAGREKDIEHLSMYYRDRNVN